MCNCSTSSSKSNICPVVIVQSTDPNTPLVTGYPANTLCFVGFVESNGSPISYDSTEAFKIYKFNGASWDLVYRPVEVFNYLDIVTPATNFSHSGAAERNLTSFKLYGIVGVTVQPGDWNSSSVTIGSVGSPFVPAFNTLFTIFAQVDTGSGAVWTPCQGILDTSGDISILSDRLGGSVVTIDNIQFDFTYSATRQ
jgi:hypothetical protein